MRDVILIRSHDNFRFRFIVLTTTFNNISVILWRSVLLVLETGLPRGNHQPVASHWQTLSHSVVSSTPCHQQGSKLTTLVVIGTDCTGSCKPDYPTITAMTAPQFLGEETPGRYKQTDLWNPLHWVCVLRKP